MNARVAFLLRDAGEGGAERSSMRLANVLSRLGCSVRVFLFKARGPLLASIDGDIEIVNLEGSFFKFSRELRSGYVDFLLPVYTAMSALLVKRFSRSASTAGLHVILSQRNMFTMDRGPLQTKLRFVRCRLLYPWASACVCISQGVADEMKGLGLLPESKIYVVYNPVVTDELSRQMEEPIEEDDFGDGGWTEILAVGRLGPQKDFATLLRAFAKVADKRDDVRLTILGEGRQRQMLENLTDELAISGRVHMPGYLPNPYPYMKRASLLVMTSLFEGFGNVAAEALACGCNVVSTNCRSGPAEILDNGKYGWLARVGDPSDVADNILKAIAAPLPRHALEERAAFFSEERAGQSYCDIFESLLSSSGRCRLR
ncbi:MAG: glycosyltransferase [Synergistaceae bacterium]|jgi:glycosyltransferase involved in cell wall biosynthesis|nr:glycosyltransferase [Synergistaceae bacterium]